MRIFLGVKMPECQTVVVVAIRLWPGSDQLVIREER